MAFFSFTLPTYGIACTISHAGLLVYSRVSFGLVMSLPAGTIFVRSIFITPALC